MALATLLSAKELIQAQQGRYATKKFDSRVQIPQDIWQALEETLVLSPSSFGLQPWKFLVVDDPGLRAQLKAVSWGQGQVEESSKLVVFLVKDSLDEADVDHFISRIAEVRNQTPGDLASYKGMMVSFVDNARTAGTLADWSARQAYIALGNFMTSAAMLGIDTCPMEGLDKAAYDRILGLEGSGYHTVCACPAGYRAEDDAYASRAKVRFPLDQVVEHR